MNWKTLASTIIFKNDFFKLKTERCLLPSNKIIEDYYLFECRDWVQVIAQNLEGNFIMAEQYRHGGRLNYLEFPGGVIDNGESPEAAAKREMLEETGFKVNNLKYLGFHYPNPALQENKIHIFHATDVTDTGKQSLDEHEELVIKFVGKKQLDELVTKSGQHSLMLSTYFAFQSYLLGSKSE